MTPSSGPPAGGTRVIFSGRDFSMRGWQLGLLACRFNDTHVRALHSSSTSASCVAPSHEVGRVPVELTNNHQQYTQAGLLFKFASVSLRAIRPSSGPLLGGTAVSIRIVGVAPTSAARLLCHFGMNNTVPVASPNLCSPSRC